MSSRTQSNPGQARGREGSSGEKRPRHAPQLPPIVPPPYGHLRDHPSPPATAPIQGRFGMHTILNPSSAQDRDARRSAAAHFQHCHSPAASLPPIEVHTRASLDRVMPLHVLPPMSERRASWGPTGASPGASRFGPHSPSGAGGMSSAGTIDARKAPFLPPAGQIISGPGSTSALPTPHAAPVFNGPFAPRTSYPFPQQRALTPPGRRGSDAPSLAPPSNGNSPTTSYSSYGPPSIGHQSPRYHQPAPVQAQKAIYGSAPLPPPAFAVGHSHHPGHQTEAAPYMQGAMLHGNGPYQLITLDTDQGPIQVPVDVQAASKMADEKRKRNAGASARFRQRRKEKEKESGSTIAKLEGQIRETNEDKEFYRMERNYFRELVYNSSAKAHVVARLPSPAERRPSQTPSQGSCSPSVSSWRESGDRESEDGRILRRRLSGYQEVVPAAEHLAYQHHTGQHGPYAYPLTDSRSDAPSTRGRHASAASPPMIHPGEPYSAAAPPSG